MRIGNYHARNIKIHSVINLSALVLHNSAYYAVADIAEKVGRNNDH